ncbi:hypothetical protein HDU99_003763 [Rhizoclosmatium hyalinum]|nr:hypothetical protein HDU99_003763 [Rhizoclosmatium hyalinum]
MATTSTHLHRRFEFAGATIPAVVAAVLIVVFFGACALIRRSKQKQREQRRQFLQAHPVPPGVPVGPGGIPMYGMRSNVTPIYSAQPVPVLQHDLVGSYPIPAYMPPAESPATDRNAPQYLPPNGAAAAASTAVHNVPVSSHNNNSDTPPDY